MLYYFCINCENVSHDGEREEIMEKAQAALPAVPLFQDLYLCTAGKSVCFSEHSFGPDVRRNYLIHYILSGYGSFVTEDKQYRLCPGQGFFIEPGWTTCYRADKEEPWTYVWVGFNGTQAAELVKGLGLGRGCPVFSCAASKELEEAVEHLLLSAPSDALLSLNQHRYLLAFLHVLAQNLASEPEAAAAGESRGNYHIDKALNFIRANYANQIHVQDIAAYLGISRYHLCRLFKESVGCSPQEYVASFCLGQARELLTTTEISVGEVALLCGYSNVEVFSKAFKKKYLTSPAQYRHYALEHPGVNPMEYFQRLEENSRNCGEL